MQEPNYAGFGRRALASLLDGAVWVVFFFWIYAWVVSGAFLASDTAGVVSGVAFFSFWFNYSAFCEWRWGQTIGKNVFGIEVRSMDGADGSPSARRARGTCCAWSTSSWSAS